MIATLRYRNGCITCDGKIVFSVIARNNAEVIKTSRFPDEFNPKVKIRVVSAEQLNKIIQEINSKTSYEVSVIKVRKEIFRK